MLEVEAVLAMFGDADDHESGVVAVVEALHGLEDVVNCVDGLLIELIDEEAGFTERLLLAAKACNSGISRGGRLVDGLTICFSGIAIPKTVSLS